ncbi:HEAT repeat domain-containing protein [Methanobrevibacter curvatus]|uniref:PBS lyase HEAT-like repeat protein n=1 Tax=Methanobrevibacter curvatus TaxID=49547 RepID=A0A166BBQ0_9EURY|nr:HEAT repeat domain-containing protein [Methanobrevibacter curvatus]KZX13123.1 PBS lyase HEAT-like repeat protein [Methanobrevibacter curvatus]
MVKTIAELIECLKNEDEFLVEETKVLLESRSDEAVEPLIDALKNNPNKDIKIGAANILGFIGDDKAIPALISALGDLNKFVRRESSTALTKMGSSAVKPLIAVLDDDDWKVRGAAAWALGSLGDDNVVDPLTKLLDDESGFVKRGAKYSIDKINGE